MGGILASASGTGYGNARFDDASLFGNFEENRAMTIEVSCTNCGEDFRMKDLAAGKEFKCRSCGTTLRVPPAIPVRKRSRPSQTERAAPVQLRLRYPPTIENAPKFAADVVAPAANLSGVDLDFSVASLRGVDDIIEGMRQQGVTADRIGATLFGFGCYVGEIFVRHARGQWRNTAETSMAKFASFPLVIQLGIDSYCNPIDKVFKRLENGEVDSLPYFYKAFTKRS